MRLRVLERRDQRREVGEIAAHELDVRQLLAHHLGLRVVLTLDDAEDFVALRVEQLSQMLTVLAGDASDQGAGHLLPLGWGGPL